MDVRLSAEQQLISDTAARLGDQHATPGIDHLPPTPDATSDAWRALADAGLIGIEGEGGAVASVLVAERLAGALSSAPYVGQGVLAPALLSVVGADDELAELTDGAARYCVLLSPDLSRVGAPEAEAIAFDAADAQYGLTVDGQGILRRHRLSGPGKATGLDLTRVAFSSQATGGEPVGVRPVSTDAGTRIAALAMTALAADQLGLMDRALKIAVEYAGQRRQFGRVIGANQALAHLLADAAVLVESSRSCVWHAAWSLDAHGLTGGDRALAAARQAKAYADAAAREVLEIATQVHGGIAITWEHVVPLMLRRVLANAQVFGAPRTQYEFIARGRQGAHAVSEPPDGAEPDGGLSFADSADEATFRDRLRAWLASHAPAPDSAAVEGDQRMEQLHHWHRTLADAGYVGLSFAREYGGHGQSLLYDAILNDELAAAEAPAGPAINHISNAIRLFGTQEQKRAYLPGMLDCTVRWCQGFSEPDAGSDLASLRTRGSLFTGEDGQSYYRVDGQKLWTSEAVWADWCLLLLRTESEGRSHQQLSMLLVPMSTPGLECRPVRTAYGSSEFAEVFFTGAIVSSDQLLGRPGQGWEIAMALLGFERGPADMGWTARLQRLLTRAEGQIRDGSVPATGAQREELAHAWVELEALRLQVLRSTSQRLDGSAPGPEGSLDKLLMTRAEQRLNHVLLDLAGSGGVLQDSDLFQHYLWSRAQAIFGGSRQIQRDIVAQRVLGLPRPPS